MRPSPCVRPRVVTATEPEVQQNTNERRDETDMSAQMQHVLSATTPAVISESEEVLMS